MSTWQSWIRHFSCFSDMQWNLPEINMEDKFHHKLRRPSRYVALCDKNKALLPPDIVPLVRCHSIQFKYPLAIWARKKKSAFPNQLCFPGGCVRLPEDMIKLWIYQCLKCHWWATWWKRHSLFVVYVFEANNMSQKLVLTRCLSLKICVYMYEYLR